MGSPALRDGELSHRILDTEFSDENLERLAESHYEPHQDFQIRDKGMVRYGKQLEEHSPDFLSEQSLDYWITGDISQVTDLNHLLLTHGREGKKDYFTLTILNNHSKMSQNITIIAGDWDSFMKGLNDVVEEIIDLPPEQNGKLSRLMQISLFGGEFMSTYVPDQILDILKQYNPHMNLRYTNASPRQVGEVLQSVEASFAEKNRPILRYSSPH